MAATEAVAARAASGHPPARRPGALPRLASPLRWPPLVGDACLTGLLALAVAATLLHDRAGAQRWVVSALLLAPLPWRRTAPVAAFTALLGAAAAQLVLGIRLPLDLVALLVLFSIADRRPRRHALVAAGLLELFGIVATLRVGTSGEGHVSSLVFTSGLVAAAFFAGTSLQERRAYLASLVDRAERLEREQAAQARLAVTQERSRIAGEMHDIVAHSLAVMITMAEGARAAGGLSGPVDDAMAAVAATGRHAMTDMRRLLAVLRDDQAAPMTPGPGLGQLEDLMESTRATGLAVRSVTVGVPVATSAGFEATVYRIVQEGLTNVLKHALDATSVRVTLSWHPDTLTVEVADDGRAPGARAGAAASTPGHGLLGMAERVTFFGGNLDAGPAGEGWQVRVRLPLEPAGTVARG